MGVYDKTVVHDYFLFAVISSAFKTVIFPG
jgi:hypothetical protein